MRNILLLFLFPILFAQAAEGGVSAPSHDLWDALLSSYVDDAGRVNYEGIRDDERFGDYLTLLRSSHPDNSWSRNERLAYWLNAYNAFTVDLVTRNWPLKSIQDIPKVWDTPFINIEQATYTLNGIEHEVIRPIFKDARIHFAVNCAAQGCPPLWNRAFTPKGLDEQLQRRTKQFLTQDARNQVSPTKLQLSKIFQWYAEDFGNVREYVAEQTGMVIDPAAAVSYLDYDWSINSRP